MKKLILLSFILILLPALIIAQEQDAKSRFYSAIVAEEIEGDLDKAISIYEEILKYKDVDRQLAAKSLYHLGICHDKKESGKAIDYFVSLLEKYPDQGDLADLARNRITKLEDANTFIDPRDGHKYKWVKIGNQIWMAENLAYMPHVNPPKKQEYGIWVYDYEGDDVAEAKATQNYQKYGCLYDWATAMGLEPEYLEKEWKGDTLNHQGLCPPGWRMPSDRDWTKLELGLGMPDSVVNLEWEIRAGEYKFYDELIQYPPIGKLFKTRYGWYVSGNGNNESGFSVLPAGVRANPSGSLGKSYSEMGYSTFFWNTNSSYWDNRRANLRNWNAMSRSFEKTSNIWRGTFDRISGFSVRCIKQDAKDPINEPETLAKGFFFKNAVDRISVSDPDEITNVELKTLKKIERPDTFIVENDRAAYMSISSLILDDKHLFLSFRHSSEILSLDPISLDTLWRFEFSFRPNLINLAIEKNFLIASTRDSLFVMNPENGFIKWKQEIHNVLIFSQIKDGVLYIPSDTSFNAVDIDSGQTIWSHSYIDYKYGMVKIKGNKLFAPLYNATRITSLRRSIDVEKHPVLNVHDIKTGELLWTFHSYDNLWHCAVNEDKVYLRTTSQVNGNNVIAVDIKNGNKLWAKFLANRGSVEPITILDNNLFMIRGSYTTYEELISMNTSGLLNWRTKIPKSYLAGNNYPIIFDGKVFYLTGSTATKEFQLVALDIETGKTLYKFDAGASVITYPIFFENKIYVGCTDGLYVFEYPEID